MKRLINSLSLIYVAVSFLFIKHIIVTTKGLILYSIINFILLIIVLYINKKKKDP